MKTAWDSYLDQRLTDMSTYTIKEEILAKENGMQMEEAKEMIKVASTFLAEQEPAAKPIRLEQIEERSDGIWSIVLSFPDLTSPVAAFLQSNSSGRVYKELVVAGDTKEVQALRFWKQ